MCVMLVPLNVLFVFVGDTITGTLTCRRTIKNVRGLAIILEIGNDKYQYNFG